MTSFLKHALATFWLFWHHSIRQTEKLWKVPTMKGEVFMRVRLLVSFIGIASFLAVAPFAAADGIGANDPIISIQSFQSSCNVVGLASSPATSTGGVHCAAAPNVPFSLTGILNGTLPLFVGNSTTPSWNVINDTGTALSSLTLFYSGALASNANLNPSNQGGSPFNTCVAVSFSGMVANNCGSLSSPVSLPATLTWSGGAGIPIGGTFNINTASFAHAGQDAGCISGTDDCLPEPTPTPTPPPVSEPGTLTLLGTAMLGMGAMLRRRLQGLA
jgi:hypothetical protein